MALPFQHVAQHSLKAAWFKRVKLVLHGLHIGGQSQPAAIVKHQVIGGVNPLQLELLKQRSPQCGEFFLKQLAHNQQGGAGVKHMPVSGEMVAASSGAIILFDYCHLETVFGQVNGRAHAANTGANNENLFRFQNFPLLSKTQRAFTRYKS